MTEIEDFNQGLLVAVEVIRFVADTMSPKQVIGSSSLDSMADQIETLKCGPPPPDAPLPAFPLPSPPPTPSRSEAILKLAMKRVALVGYTRIDAMCWLAYECGERGCSMMVSANQRTATLGHEVFSIFYPGEMPDPSKFDQIIERKEGTT